MAKKRLVHSDKDWKKILTEKEFKVLRKKGTEPPFSGKYVSNKDKGLYVCAGCGNPLFNSEAKFDSGTGWPSFSKPVSDEKGKKKPDHSLGLVRTEVLCSVCGGHLGHVFDDGPKPTGLRYCMNSVALHFKKK